MLSCVLEGPTGSGKSALAATVALESDFPYIKVISPESMVGFAEQVSEQSCKTIHSSEDMPLVAVTLHNLHSLQLCIF